MNVRHEISEMFLSQQFYFIEEIQSAASDIFNTIINRMKL